MLALMVRCTVCYAALPMQVLSYKSTLRSLGQTPSDGNASSLSRSSSTVCVATPPSRPAVITAVLRT